MGAVYRGRDPELDRLVAIKVMLDSTPDFVARFRREAQAIAKLVHPHIVQVYDFGVDDEGNPYFVMELIEGRPLDKIVRAEGRLDAARAIGYARQAADGLAAAHRVGIVHRDVKPSNLIVDARGVVKIVDFGIARVATGGTALTGAAALMGTPGYMAPEQAQGKPVDGRADIYALGLTLFEMLSGQAPYQAEDPISLVVKNLQEPLPDLRVRGLGLPDELVVLVEQMSAKSPDERLRSMEAVQAALDDVLMRLKTNRYGTVAPSTNPSASASGSAIPPTNVHDSLPPAVAAATPSTGTGAGAGGGGRMTMILGGVGALLAVGGVAAFFALRPPPEKPKDPTTTTTTTATTTQGRPGDVAAPNPSSPTTQNAANPPGLNPANVVARPGAGVKEGPLRVAVLKFKNMSSDPELTMLEKGIAETAVNDLVGKVPNVTILERNDLESDISEIDKAGDFHFDPLTVAKLGQLKGVEYAIQGGIQKWKGQMRITARFVRVENGEVLDTLTYTGRVSPFKAQDEVAAGLGEKLRLLAKKEGR
jgi:serine/threonine-protein kinase